MRFDDEDEEDEDEDDGDDLDEADDLDDNDTRQVLLRICTLNRLSLEKRRSRSLSGGT